MSDSASTAPAPFIPQSVDDIDAATVDQLKQYLDGEKVSYGKTALKPELVSKAREHFTSKAAAPAAPADTEKPNIIPPGSLSEREALDMLVAKGFKSKDEVIHVINDLERKTVDLRITQKDIDEKVALLEQKDIEYASREAAIKKDVEKFVELNKENDRQCQELIRQRELLEKARG